MASAPTPATIQNIKYVFDTSIRIGTSALVAGSESSSGRKVVARAVEHESMGAFMKGEGQVRYVLNIHQHPSIARVSAVVEPGRALEAATGAPSGKAFVVMEEMFGDLHAHIRTNGPLDEALARTLFLQIAQGIKHCHSLGVVLRDLKLGKIMFADSNGGGSVGGNGSGGAAAAAAPSRVVLADLDGAQVLPQGAPPTLCDQKGSPAYVAPEVLACKPYCGHAADIWSLGVVLYVMLTGTYPFQDPSPAGLFRKISLGAYPVPRHVSPAAQRLLRRMLSRDPAARISIEQILEHRWLQTDSPQAGGPCPSVAVAAPAPAHTSLRSPCATTSTAVFFADARDAKSRADPLVEEEADTDDGVSGSMTAAAPAVAREEETRRGADAVLEEEDDDQVVPSFGGSVVTSTGRSSATVVETASMAAAAAAAQVSRAGAPRLVAIKRTHPEARADAQRDVLQARGALL